MRPRWGKTVVWCCVEWVRVSSGFQAQLALPRSWGAASHEDKVFHLTFSPFLSRFTSQVSRQHRRILLVQLFLIDFFKNSGFSEAFLPTIAISAQHHDPCQETPLSSSADMSHSEKAQLEIPHLSWTRGSRLLRQAGRPTCTGVFKSQITTPKALGFTRKNPSLLDQHPCTSERVLQPFYHQTIPVLQISLLIWGKLVLLILYCVLFPANTVNQLADQPFHIPTTQLPTSL